MRRSDTDGAAARLLLAMVMAAPHVAHAQGRTDRPLPVYEQGAPYPIHDVLIDDSAVAYATFSSTWPHVVSNAHGVFLTYLEASNSNYTNQTWHLLQSTDGGATFRVAHTETNNTQTPAIETDAAGNLYLFRPKWNTTGSGMLRLLAPSYGVPARYHLANAGGAKFTTVIDEARGRVHYFTNAGRFVSVGLEGTIHLNTDILTAGAKAYAQYTSLTLAANGVLHAAWYTQARGSSSYRSIHAVRSPDGGVSWTKLDGTPLMAPFVDDETGPTDMINDVQELALSKSLTGFMAKDDKLHFVYWQQAATNHRMRYKRYDASGRLEVDGLPFFGGRGGLKGNHGGLAADRSTAGSTLYWVGTEERRRQVCFASDDNGAHWYRYAAGSTAYPMNSAGWHGIYATCVARDLTADVEIVGAFTEVAPFAVTYYEPNSGKVHFFRIQAGLSSARVAAVAYAAGQLVMSLSEVRGNPVRIRFNLGTSWTTWKPFASTLSATLPSAPRHYQLESSLRVASPPQRIRY